MKNKGAKKAPLSYTTARPDAEFDLACQSDNGLEQTKPNESQMLHTYHSYLGHLVDANNGLSPSDRALLLVVLAIGGPDGCCYMTSEHLGARAGLRKRQTIRSLKSLTDRGWLLKSPATDEDVPKARGWVYRLNQGAFSTPSNEPEGAFAAPSNAAGVQQMHPDIVATTKTQTASKTLKTKRNGVGCINDMVPLMHPSRSTTTLLPSDDAGSGGATSRVRAATDGATQPTPDAIERLQQEIVTALAGVDKYYPDPEQQAPHAVKQNRKHVRDILKTLGDIETAIDYVQLRGVEWCARVEAGQDYCSPIVLAMLAEDAKEGWVRPKNAGQALKKKIKHQIEQQLACKAKWQIRAGWEEEYYRYADVPAQPAVVEVAPVIEESYEREPVALGEVIEQLVPQVSSGVRRVPQGAFRPKWWAGLAGELSNSSVLRDAGVDASEGHAAHLALAATLLVNAHVEVQGEVAWVRQGDIETADLERVAAYSKDWERALSLRARQLQLAQRVRWAGNALTEQTALVEAVKEEPKAAPVVHGPRPASPRPLWWDSMEQQLGLWASRHQQMPDKAAVVASVRQLIPVLAKAKRAWLDGDQFTIELNSLGALRAVWPLLEPVVGWVVQLYADLPRVPSVVVVELANSTAGSVEVHP